MAMTHHEALGDDWLAAKNHALSTTKFSDAVTDWLVDDLGFNSIDVAEKIAELWAAASTGKAPE